MVLSKECKECLLRRQREKVKDVEDGTREAYLKEVEDCIDTFGRDYASPVISEQINLLYEKYFHVKMDFEEVKKKYNQVMLAREEEIARHIEVAEDSLKQALLYARAGNYIDFGALGSVNDEKLDEILERCKEEALDARTYDNFVKTCQNAKNLVYLLDNCGEIVLDKLLIKQLKNKFPQCEITVLVRGKNVLNDATLADAAEVGLDKVAKVVPNGSGIAGTSLSHISDEARLLMEQADCILSKGQGNFETLNGCGLNVFYLFLCKCPLFVTRFGLPRFEGVFVRDCDL